jgi:putative addiction module component (TIGR02574 family)
VTPSLVKWPAAVSPHRVKWGMAEDAAELLTHALKLPPAARAAIADSLIDSLDAEVDEDAEEAWRSEIALRVRDLDSGAVQTIAWDEVRRQLRTRFNG